ncbi:FAD-dependent pyridine nucleotide-disulfide oxidoreductase [Pseudopedobacter saltans DSM 12145]|uniref:NADH:ubiquinone reductase (non-electrogenic) n=1 Tax=Pseudopedobacter saltans (strain ATCC 51119 / DSM 12145 / JCM 21818 / CCUG 39354 / LMG 10337 / NBRC 100064 / NCIMB 13643) TaxID=762903 RepID=F0S5Q0_PSESL|nr:NAD(P)/FAD-dependent oxidoreductase [Pseudopedobacter saltans]ADY54224.1 FAD-dependent pyridine nucleotide-disulfide oxidoreductase [Pseudopedobacter saltans DSM 12145]
MSNSPKKIIIVGGGFAGINLVRKLAKSNLFDITLVDKNNYNFFPPLIYQVATGFLENSNISYPFRKLFRDKNVRFRMGAVLRVIPEDKTLILDTGKLSYDYLVFATGTETNYFGLENVKNNAIPMKTLDDALLMRNILLERLEKATIAEDQEEKTRLMTVVIAGGGPTGVEISGMLAELRKSTVRREYPELVGTRFELYLVNGGGELLSPMSVKSQTYTLESLEKLGVNILLNTRVTDFKDSKVYLGNGDTIEAETLIWASGVKAISFEGLPANIYGSGNRMIVDSFNKVRGMEDIYALGDTCVVTEDPEYPGGHPQLAQVAIQQGKNLAANFMRILKQEPLLPFKYDDKGSMAIIGKNKAVADIPFKNIHFQGFIAWLAWLFIHLMSLLNYRNRMKTLYNWSIAYFTKDNSLRMIIRPGRNSNKG